MKVLLIGGSGMVGSFITPYLAKHHELRVLDMVPPKRADLVEYIQGSISNPDDVARALDGMDTFVNLVMRSPQGGSEFGISLLYITHDLTTAYQVCDNIVVLYQGSVTEAGSVERVIRDPKHPYTQLLVSSIPQTDRSQRWGNDEIPIAEANVGRATSGCRFAPRCAAVMEECWQRIPPLFQIDSDRAASCYLHKQAPVLPSEGIGRVFHRPVETSTPTP